LRAIAARAGVSVATVSLALRDHASLPPRTRQRIQRLAARMGYQIDPKVAKLMAYLRQRRRVRTTSALGLLNLHADGAPWRSNPFLRRLRDAASQRAEQFGYELVDCWLTAAGMTPARMRDILLTRGIEGLVLMGAPQWRAALDFDLSCFACAALGYSLRLPLHRACQHQYQEMFMTLRHLDRLGYRRPGLMLTEDADQRTLHHWSAAFLSWQQSRRAADRVPFLCSARLDQPVFQRWFARHRPDVVIAQSPSATTLCGWLADAGSPAPRACGFADLDVDPGEGCSGIRQNYEQVAAAAVDLVVAQILRNEHGIPAHPKVVLIEGEWVDGGTTRAQPL
jgi:LacI family transcriptional regulator